MADFDQFASAEPTGQEEDPAAAFLAREQDQLAALEDDDFGISDGQASQEPNSGEFSGSGLAAAAPVPTSDTDLFGDVIQASSGGPNVMDLDQDVEPGGAASGTESGDAGFDPFTSGGQQGEAQIYAHEDIPQQTLDDYASDSDTVKAHTEPTVDPYASVRSHDNQRTEPEKILKWREEQKEMLVKKDADSEMKKGEWREVARKEVEDWYKHRDEQLEKTKASNREAEAAFVHDRDEKLAGHEWERITRLCEFNPKSSRNTKDIARMRSILLQLKQTPLQRA